MGTDTKDLNVLIIVPGGVDRSGKTRVIPALLALFRQLGEVCRVVVVATSQDDILLSYSIDDYQVISLPRRSSLWVWRQDGMVSELLHSLSFKPDIIHSFWLGLPTLLAGFLARRYRVPLLASIAGGELVSLPEVPYGGCLRMRDRAIMKYSLYLASAVTTGSHFLLDICRSQLSRGKIVEVVPLGIDTTFWRRASPDTRERGKWGILHLASINKVKNLSLLLDIARSMKKSGFPFHVHSVGIDTLDGAVHRQAERMGLAEDITFHGFQEQEQVRGIMDGLDFVVQTSFFESQGVAVLEAVSQGLCPVGTRVGWLRDMGLGVDPREPDISKKLCRELIDLANSAERRTDRVVKLQRWVERHSSRYTAQRMGTLYRALL